MNIGKFKVRKVKFSLKSEVNIEMENDEVTVQYFNKVGDFPKIPNGDSLSTYDITFDNTSYKDIADYIMGKTSEINSSNNIINKEFFGYLNKFRINEIKNVKLRHTLCFTKANLIQSILFFVLLMIPFLYIHFKTISIFNVNNNFNNLYLIALFLILFILWSNTIKVIEISFINKSKKKVIIPVYGYIFFILNAKKREEIYNAYKTLKSLIKN